MRKILILLLATLFAANAMAADLAREQRIAEQIEEAILDGDPIRLKDGAHEFLGIYMRTDVEPVKGAVLLLHGQGANPDWVDVIQPLRIGLTEYGWETLSIQLPVAHEGASDREWMQTVPEAAPRISAALAFLQQRNMRNVAIVAHSFGARQAADFLAQQTPGSVQAFVAIGMSGDPAKRDSGNLGALRKIKLKMLDLYGEQDLRSVLDSARERRIAARDAGNSQYEQRQVPGADHFFTGQDAQLLAIVRAWLARQVAGTEIKR